MKDIFGKALLDYCNKQYTEDLITATSISSEDILPLPYLFRSYDDMPKLEQKALAMCQGKILDVGCGAGSHSLWLAEKKFQITSIDISKGAIEVCKQRKIPNPQRKSLLEVRDKFDSILILMNGTGLFETLDQIDYYLKHLKSCLETNGQILIDSSDIKYMYEDEDGGFWIDTNANYYGELDYFISYKGEQEIPMKWLYLDFNTLNTACQANDLICELVVHGDHHDYLAKISHKV